MKNYKNYGKDKFYIIYSEMACTNLINLDSIEHELNFKITLKT